MTDMTEQQPTTPETEVPEFDEATESAEAGDAAPTLESLQQELESARAQHARAVADYQNLERRAREERTEVGRLALAGVISAFLPVLDDLQRAIEAAPDSADANWLEGVNLVAQKFSGVLTQSGVEEIHALGQAFDPNMHEAVGQAPGPEGQVVHLLRRGYTLKGNVIRPAMVMVGNGDNATSTTDSQETTV